MVKKQDKKAKVIIMATVVAKKVNVRSKPEMGNNVVGQVVFGDRLRIIPTKGLVGWVMLFHEEKMSYIKSEFVEVDSYNVDGDSK